MRVLAIDPGLRCSGVCLLSPGHIEGHWTVRHAGTLDTLPDAVATWLVREAPLHVERTVIELPPPRIRGQRYQIEPAVAAGVWLHALRKAGYVPRLVAAGDWQREMLGPSKTWPKGDSKAVAALRCRAEGFELPNEHERDAALIALWVKRRVALGLGAEVWR